MLLFKTNVTSIVVFLVFLFRPSITVSMICTSSEYQCNNGNCIPSSMLCNYVQDCEDGSDEMRYLTGFKCRLGENNNTCVLPQQLLYDNFSQCADSSDLCRTINGVSECQKCRYSNITIAKSQMCDGVIDCPDLSDECLCENTKARAICSGLQVGNTISCGNQTNMTISFSKVCDGIIDCSNSWDELFCRNTASFATKTCLGYKGNSTIAFPCDGIPECLDLSDECDANCSTSPNFCSLIKTNLSFDNQSFVCSTSRGGNITFHAWDICNGGWVACDPRLPQEEERCPARFYCPEKMPLSIESEQVCNGIVDCLNGSDERNCLNRFYCLNGNPISVPLTYVMDTHTDCSDSSDECPPALDNDIYSSRYKMIKNLGIEIWLWIMALAGLFGNSVVFIYTVRLLKGGDLTAISRGNHYMVLNLNIADIMMSIYLLILAIKAVQFSGHYCFVDLPWRISVTCSFIGPFAGLSAQVSLFTLVVMTSQRLYSVYWPIKAMTIKLRWIYISILLLWIIFITIAAIPAIMPDVFVDGLWMPTKYLKKPVVRSPLLDSFVQTVQLLDPSAPNPPAIVGLTAQEKYLKENGYPVKGRFGYYSESSICVPHFFTPIADNGWQYPTSIVSINMIAFIYVAFAYALIYKKTTATKLRSTKSMEKISRHMQRRITKLVFANFACWLPICVASYVQLALPVEVSHRLFVVTAVFLFPINSVVNPLLYSDVFEKLYFKLKKCFSRVFENAFGGNAPIEFSTTEL